MKFPLSRIHFIGIVLLFLVSCNNRSCKTNSEVHTESREETIGEDTFVMEVALIESTRYRKLRKTGSSYSIAYNLKRNGQELPMSIEHPDVEYGIDLMPYLNNLSIEVAEDNFAFRITSGDKIIGTFLNLEGEAIESPFGNDGKGNINVEDQSQVNIALLELRPEVKSYPLSVQPSKLELTQKLVNGELNNIAIRRLGSGSNNSITSFLLKQNLSENDLFTLFKRWPDGSFIDGIFSEERMTEFQKSKPIWADSVRALISKPTSRGKSDLYLGLIYNQFKDEKLIHEIDKEFYEGIGTSFFLSHSEKEWIENRLSCDVPLYPELDVKFRKVVKRSLENYPKGTEDPFDLEFNIDVAFPLAKFLGEDQLINNLMPKMLETKLDDYNRVSNPIFSDPELIAVFDEDNRMKILNNLFNQVSLEESNEFSDMQDLVSISLKILNESNQQIIANKWLGKMDYIDGIPLKDFVNSLAPILGCEVVENEIAAYKQRNGDGDEFWLRIDEDNCN